MLLKRLKESAKTQTRTTHSSRLTLKRVFFFESDIFFPLLLLCTLQQHKKTSYKNILLEPRTANFSNDISSVNYCKLLDHVSLKQKTGYINNKNVSYRNVQITAAGIVKRLFMLHFWEYKQVSRQSLDYSSRKAWTKRGILLACRVHLMSISFPTLCTGVYQAVEFSNDSRAAELYKKQPYSSERLTLHVASFYPMKLWIRLQ